MEEKRSHRGLRAASASAALVIAFAVAGCGDDGSDSGGGYGAPDAGETEGGGVEPASLTLSETDLGSVVADSEGMTLYLFTEDAGGESTCYDQCAVNWPPLISEGEPEVEGDLDASLLGTVERDDGSSQVTYNGHPLYRWVDDAAPGDVTGQGVNDVWFVVSPEGEAVAGQ